MKNKEYIVKQIMKYCPYEWAKDESNVRRVIPIWNLDKELWNHCQTCGFVFKTTKSGRRYIETMPVRIYFD